MIGLSIISLIYYFLAGHFEAMMDLLQFKWDKVKHLYVGKEHFYDPKISWANKWKNGDKSQGEKFLFSTTILVGFTDGWHKYKRLRNWMLFIGVGLSALSGWVWIAPLAYIINRIGFTLTYNYLYK